MILPNTTKDKWRSRFFLLAALLAVLLGWIVPIYYNITVASKKQDLRPADVIIVFGAAEYAGHPSPTLKARLDHALELYRRGLAPALIVTGGAGADPKFSEGGVGRDYLIEHGVPQAAVIAEMQSSDTHQSAQRVANIMRTNHMQTALAVSDGYHMFRVQQMMASEGVDVFPAPRPQNKPLSMMQRVLINLREVVSFTLWKMHIT